MHTADPGAVNLDELSPQQSDVDVMATVVARAPDLQGGPRARDYVRDQLGRITTGTYVRQFKVWAARHGRLPNKPQRVRHEVAEQYRRVLAVHPKYLAATSNAETTAAFPALRSDVVVARPLGWP